MDESVNQTAIRSLNTSITTLFSVIAILIFWWSKFKNFYNDIVNRILAGTYSSIFIATPIVYLLNKRKVIIWKICLKMMKKMKMEKE